MLLIIGVVILLGMAGAVLYNQLTGLYNEVVLAGISYQRRLGELRDAINAGSFDQGQQAKFEEMIQKQPLSWNLATPVDFSGVKQAWLSWQNAGKFLEEAREAYLQSRSRFPMSAIAGIFGFKPLDNPFAVISALE